MRAVVSQPLTTRIDRGRVTKGENLQRIAKRRALLALAVGLAAAATMIAAAGGSARGEHAAVRGAKTPAIGVSPKYQFIGDVASQPNLSVFGCQTRTIASGTACYGPDQIQTAYSIKPLLAQGLNGSGRTIVIVDAYGSPTINQDLALFDTAFNLPAPTFQIVKMDPAQAFDPTDANQVGWSAETSLDVQWAHAVAPGA